MSQRAKDALCRVAEDAYSRGQARPQDYVFSARWRRGAISRQQAYRIISKALTAAGVTHTKGTHTARKTFAALLLRHAETAYRTGESKVLPLIAVQRGLGHQEIATTQRYLESGVEAVNTIIRKGIV